MSTKFLTPSPYDATVECKSTRAFDLPLISSGSVILRNDIILKTSHGLGSDKDDHHKISSPAPSLKKVESSASEYEVDPGSAGRWE